MVASCVCGGGGGGGGGHYQIDRLAASQSLKISSVQKMAKITLEVAHSRVLNAQC